MAVALNRHRDRARRRAVAARHEGALAALAEMSPWARAPRWASSASRAGGRTSSSGSSSRAGDPALAPGEAAAPPSRRWSGSRRRRPRGPSSWPRGAWSNASPRASTPPRALAGRRAVPDASADRLDAVLARSTRLQRGLLVGRRRGPIPRRPLRARPGLTRSLAEVATEAPRCAGSSPSLLLHDARRPARLDAGGARPLPDQGTDPAGTAPPSRPRSRSSTTRSQTARPGVLPGGATVAAVHCRAPTAEVTDWREIAALYGCWSRCARRPRCAPSWPSRRAGGGVAALAMIEAGGAADGRRWCTGRCWRRRGATTRPAASSHARSTRRATATSARRSPLRPRRSPTGGHDEDEEERRARGRASPSGAVLVARRRAPRGGRAGGRGTLMGGAARGSG